MRRECTRVLDRQGNSQRYQETIFLRQSSPCAQQIACVFKQSDRKQVKDSIRCLDIDGKEIDHDKAGYGCLDCNRLPNIHPNASEKEICDQIDNNCSLQVDDSPACGCDTHEIDGAVFCVMSYSTSLAASGIILSRVGQTAGMDRLGGAVKGAI